MWSKIKTQLLNRIHPSIKKDIDFQCTRYRGFRSYENTVFRILFKKEVIFTSSCLKHDYESRQLNAKQLDENEIYSDSVMFEANKMLNTLPIKEALTHDNKFVKILAILDKRVGVRTLKNFDVKNENEIIKKFYQIRVNNERI